MISVNYCSKSNKFLMTCAPHENELLVRIPDRRYRPATRIWAVPVLRRNIEYMINYINNPLCFSKEALDVFNSKKAEISKPIQGETAWPSWYKFNMEPLAHQVKGFKKFFPLDWVAIFYEQGLGKTYESINLACAWRMTNQIEAVVVVCPSSIKLVWKDELIKHSPIELQSCHIEPGNYKKVDKFIAEKTDFQWLIVGVEALSQGNAPDYVKRFLMSRRCLMVVDESSNIKNHGKVRTDNCIDLGKYAKKRAILSGTSITEGLENLYTQFKFLNPDIIGFNSFYTFRANFCVTMNMIVGYDNYGREKTIQKVIGYKNENELLQLIQPYTERVEKKDCPDFPEKTFTCRYVNMSPAQKQMYNDAKLEMFVEQDGVEYEIKTQLEAMLRLQQITGGHYPHDDGEKVVAKAIPGKNPKVEELLSFLDEISGKLVVFARFRSEVEAIHVALDKADIPHVQFHGGMNGDQKEKSVSSFQNDPKTRVFIGTRAAAYGLTLTAASHMLYFSQPFALEEDAQSQDRIHRIGQKNACSYTYLLCDKTIDIKIRKALEAKASMADLFYSILKD